MNDTEAYKIDRLHSAINKPICWKRQLLDGDVVPELVTAMSKIQDRQISMYCRAAAREQVHTVAAMPAPLGQITWQPLGELTLVTTSEGNLFEILAARGAQHEQMRRKQPETCRSCCGKFATGAVVWETNIDSLFCDRCFRERQRVGARLRSYCRAADWTERASESARKRLFRAVQQVIDFEESIARISHAAAL
jgi:hypothetical protein